MALTKSLNGVEYRHDREFCMEGRSADCKIKHLEMIEAVIGRMGSNSFKLKGWAVTLISIAGAFSAQGDDKRCFLLAFVPLVSFWLLDAYYLQIERKYRVLFEHVSSLSEDSVDFDMDVRHIACKNQAEAHRCRYRACVFSRTEAWFYGGIAVLMLLFYGLAV